uniref:Cuticle protein 14 isoform b n=1 Tax=Aceria tosichella TaxID=561515 RepID=A0A6G1S550_9ACAR
MKVAICIVSVVAVTALVASASHVPTGASSQYRSQNNLGQYSFGFDEAGATGGSFRHERSLAPGTVQGSYGLNGADGKLRIVHYTADPVNGFQASIQTNEMAEPRDSAGVAVNHAATVVAAAPVAAPVPVAPAPVPVAAPAPVPVAVAAAPAPVPVYAAAQVLPALAPPAAFGYHVVAHHYAPAALGYYRS